jgi:DNA-binding transcriptional regulator YiaG
MSKELVRKLKAARELVGETQVVFAERLGVPTRTLIGWETNALREVWRSKR